MKTGMAISPDVDLQEAVTDIPGEFEFVEAGIGEMERRIEDIETQEWKNALQEHGLDLVVHLPFRQPLATTAEQFNTAEIEYLTEVLDTAEELGAEKAVLHANIRYGEEKEVVKETLKSQVEIVDSIARERSIELCVENIPFKDSRIAELMEFGEIVRETGASICLDTGHAFAEDGQEALEEFAEEFSDLISHLHVQDSRGGDDHLAVGHGDIEFKSFLEKLGDFHGTVCFEVFSPDYEYHAISRRKLLEHF